MITCPARLIRVFISPRDRRKGVISVGSLHFPCALGRSGAGLKKREGDGISPLGTYGLRRLHYRPDRLRQPHSFLPIRRMAKTDWWADDPLDRHYNRLVRNRPMPPASKEGLWRADGLYDLVVEIGYNDRPAQRGKGSGIFLHLAREGFLPTEGCVAVTRSALLRLLPLIGPKTKIRIG